MKKALGSESASPKTMTKTTKTKKSSTRRGVRTRAKYWIGTLNNFLTEDEEALKGLPTTCADAYACWQVECGTLETPHLQAFIALKEPCSLVALKSALKCPGWHLEAAASPKQAMEYCQKEDSRVRGPYTFGTEPIFEQVLLWVLRTEPPTYAAVNHLL